MPYRDTLRLIHVTCDACGEARATVERADGVVCADCARDEDDREYDGSGHDAACARADEREANLNARWAERIAPALDALDREHEREMRLAAQREGR